MVLLTGFWEAWPKLIWFSPQKQLPFISHWSCSRVCQTTFGICSMCVLKLVPLLFSCHYFYFFACKMCLSDELVLLIILPLLVQICNCSFLVSPMSSSPFSLLFFFWFALRFILAVMHDLRLIHTDLKPENILLVSSEYIKVPDYKV